MFPVRNLGTTLSGPPPSDRQIEVQVSNFGTGPARPRGGGAMMISGPGCRALLSHPRLPSE
eukprot:752482-Hanusia_phi.AAC.7